MMYLSKESKKMWDDFRKKFTKDFISNKMTKDEYVVGLGSHDSFCYIVEYGLKCLGAISGHASSKKFGVYYSKKRNKYDFEKHFGKNFDDAFKTVKRELVKLIDHAEHLTKFKDIDSVFGPMVRYKIMYMYNPNIMVPGYVKEDLAFFVNKLGYSPKTTYEDLQNQLIKIREQDVSFSKMNNQKFGTYLFDTFGRSINTKEISANKNLDDALNEKIQKTKFIKCEKYVPHVVEVPKPQKYNKETNVYPRNVEVSARALQRANFKCENEQNHKLFDRKSDGTPYTEVHHLVPMAYQKQFLKASLDVEANIVSLCPSCHREIHLGKNRKVLIEKLYNQRKEELKQAGIIVTLKELLKMYDLK